MLDLVFFKHLDNMRVIEGISIVPVPIRVVILSSIWGVYGVNLTTLFLSKRHENDWSFSDHCVNDDGREDYHEDGAKGKTKVALATPDIAV